VVVEYEVQAPGWTAPPLKVLLLSDIHVIAPDMPVKRLRRIVRQANALKPDIILMAGDFTSRRIVSTRHIPPGEAIAPLAGLNAPLGVFAVLGNHDMEVPGRDREVETALRQAGVTVLRNRSVVVRGIRIVGVDDAAYGQTLLPDALRGRLKGEPTLFLVHNPDVAAQVLLDVPVVLAGHTHGGQIAPPLIGPLITGTQLDWTRGVYQDRGRFVVVTSGIGASLLPLRIGVPPELVLVRIRRGTATP